MADILKRLRATSLVEPPAEWKHRGKVYLRGDLAGIDESRSTSKWWDFGKRYALANTPGAIAGWLCCYEGCDSRFLLVKENGAYMAQRHMQTVHGFAKKKTQDDDSIPASSQRSSEAGNSEIATYKTLFYNVDERKIQDQCLRLFIINHDPFSRADSVEFRALLRLLNPQTSKIALSRRTIRRRALEAFDSEKLKIKAMLNQAKSKIHISFDMWSSPNRLAVFGVVAHFVRQIEVEDKVLHRQQAVLLGLKRMRDKHGAAEMAQEIIDLALDFEISQRLACFQSDNPQFNDNTVRDVLEVLEPTYQYCEERRGRCIGHIINLAARNLILGTDVDAFHDQVVGQSNSQPKRSKESMRRAQDVWRSRGALGKLHNLVKTIRVGPQRSELFKKIMTGNDEMDRLQPIQDNDTRWLSHYYSIERAVLIRPRLETFSSLYRDTYTLEPLSSDDWATLEQLITILQPFYLATKDLQSSATKGHHSSVWEWISTIEYLYKFTSEKVEEFQTSYGEKHPMTVAIQNCWQKLDVYWRLSDKAETLYAAATILAPRGRKAYFDRNWPKAETDSMIKTVHRYWQEHYASRQGTSDKPARAKAPTPREIMLGAGISSSKKTHDDPLMNYVHQPPETNEVDVLNWWQQFGPVELQTMALDIISCPAMSAEIERVFSSSKKLLTPERNALNRVAGEV